MLEARKRKIPFKKNQRWETLQRVTDKVARDFLAVNSRKEISVSQALH